MTRTISSVFAILLVIGGLSAGADRDQYRALRAGMVHEIEEHYQGTAQATGKQALDARLRNALLKVPRHEFVSQDQVPRAYRDHPLPIGHGQTISQPFIVALMTDLAEVSPEATVLEIGTGSGYQAAVLAELVKKVYTVEIIRELGEQARERLNRLGYANVETRIADGYYGWKEKAPFDAILVTAATGHVPLPLVQQLKPGGRIIVPLGGVYDVQMLVKVTKDRSGQLKTRQVIPVRFVPMTGQAQEAP